MTPDSQAWEDLNEVFRASRRAKALMKPIPAFSRRAEQKSRPMRGRPSSRSA